jgi:hypothetical protein
MTITKYATAAAILLGATASAIAADSPTSPEATVMYYMRVPTDGSSRQEREPIVGFQLQGKRDYQVVNMDTRMLKLFDGGILEAKVLIIGAVAAGAAVVASTKSKSETSQNQQQEQQQAQAPASTEPCTCWARKYLRSGLSSF